MESYLLLVEVGSKSSEWESEKGEGSVVNIKQNSKTNKLTSRFFVWKSKIVKLVYYMSPVFGSKGMAMLPNFPKIIKSKMKNLLNCRLMTYLPYSLCGLKAQTKWASKKKLVDE